ncbi:MAG: phosphoribosylanthranilate isomerase [Acidimicrobiia bacterium]|nr:phosphoribosylanthranilate isomerase [Acidimicrobiia bacterium]NNL69503.1 phosphoribosylanthranilate isomerase [Acidimicrobiia bacterium]
MTWVKVCGLSRPEEVEAAVTAGVDAIGFVFYEPSPRHVTPSHARSLAESAGVLTVAVTVDLDADSLLHLADMADVGAVQPHGAHAGEAAAAAVAAGLAVLRPVPVGGPVDLAAISGDELPLLDSDSIGGTGATFDWSWLDGLERPFVLAGGLGPGNVAEAIERVGPWGVDASSGLESAPGVKDLAKVAEFVQRAKAI